MKTSAFLCLLRAHADLPLVFRAGGDFVPAGFHVTEVKRVAYDTMDCGAAVHHWNETQVEIWAPPLVGALPGRTGMTAGKFLGILDRTAEARPFDGDTEVRFHTVLGRHPAALYDVDTVAPSAGRLWIELTADRTRCKAAERKVGTLVGGCCGIGEDAQGSPTAEAEGCGCSTPAEKTGQKTGKLGMFFRTWKTFSWAHRIACVLFW